MIKPPRKAEALLDLLGLSAHGMPEDPQWLSAVDRRSIAVVGLTPLGLLGAQSLGCPPASEPGSLQCLRGTCATPVAF
jgi:hypothetical protein